MRYLIHDSGDSVSVKNAQVLGEESPLEFDDDGRAGPVADELAETVAAMDAHVTVGGRVRDHSAADGEEAGQEDGVDGDGGDEDDAFDASAFVDRTPMDGVVEDIESGEVDAHLEEIAAAADRVGVQDAVEARME